MHNIINYFKKYFFLIKIKPAKIVIMISLFVLSGCLDILGIGAIPYLIKMLEENIDIVSKGNFNDNSVTLSFSIFVLCCFYFKSYLSFIVNKKIIRFSIENQSKIIIEFLNCYNKGAYSVIKKISLSKVLNIVDNNIRLYIEQTLMASLKIISEIIILLFIMTYLLYNYFINSLLLLTMFAIIFYVYDKKYASNFKLSSRKSHDSSIGIINDVHQSIEGFKELRVMGLEKIFIDKLSANVNVYAVNNTHALTIRSIPKYYLESTLITFLFVMSLLLLINNYSISYILSTNIIFVVCGLKIAPSAFQIISSVSSIRFSHEHMNELYSVLVGLNASMISDDDSFALEKIEFNKLSCKAIGFSFDDSDNLDKNYLFRNISFDIKVGDCVQICGDSGRGKTTLIDIIVGLLDPTEGDIYLNNNLESPHKSFKILNSKICYIPQFVIIYETTIYENITFCSDKNMIDLNKLIKCCKDVDIYKLINSLDQKFMTKIGPNGHLLSGGERKKIALARALYYDKEIFVLDELTSGLDYANELIISNIVNRLVTKNNKTILFTSHNSNHNFNVNSKIYL